MAFTPEKDLTAIQNILMADKEILKLLDLEGKPRIEIAKKIIKRSQWDDLATSDKRLCIFFVPDRGARNESFMQSVVEIDVHVPASEDYKAWRIQERVKLLFHKKRINKKYIKFNGQLGELPTMQGFFCCGSRFKFYRTI